MRIIFLNSWFGKAGKPYFDFVKKEASRTDIFCFMEVTPELHNNLSKILKDFKSVYDEGLFLKEIGTMCGQAVFVSKRIKLLSNRKVSIYRQLKDDMGFMQSLKLQSLKREFWIGNVHGKTRPGTKIDTTVRLEQSEKIINYFADKDESKIIGGDFNLNPDTKSVKMFEEAGYRNLIKDFGIKNTRNRLSWEKFNNIQYFADYIFISPEVKVKNFEVPYMEISDHLPLILEFDI